MCNPYQNYGSCSISSASKNCQPSGRLDDCHRFVHLIHHWYDKAEMPKKCTCCAQIRCKKNNLLHKLCPVPGLRGETMKKVLFTQTVPLCACPPLMPTTVVPKTELCEETVLRKGIPKDESNPAGRLLVELNASAGRCCTRAAATQKREMNTFLKGLNCWYAKEMNGPAYTPCIESKPRKRGRKQKRISGNRNSYHWASDFNFTLENDTSNSILSITSDTRISIITTNTDDTEEIDETVAMEDITNLLKQIQRKPKRPILFHSPFVRDVAWTWRNYDPLNDLPKSLEKKKNYARTSGYTPWTMNIVNDLIEGKPVSDKQFRTNSELQNVVKELALEIKHGKVRRLPPKER